MKILEILISYSFGFVASCYALSLLLLCLTGICSIIVRRSVSVHIEMLRTNLVLLVAALTLYYMIFFTSVIGREPGEPLTRGGFERALSSRELDLSRETNLIGRRKSEIQTVFGHGEEKALPFFGAWCVEYTATGQCDRHYTVKAYCFHNLVVWDRIETDVG